MRVWFGLSCSVLCLPVVRETEKMLSEHWLSGRRDGGWVGGWAGRWVDSWLSGWEGR